MRALAVPFVAALLLSSAAPAAADTIAFRFEDAIHASCGYYLETSIAGTRE